MTLQKHALPVEIVETIEDARMVLAGALPSASAVKCFATALVQIADMCVIGMPCAKHGGAVHGREAEELRAGVERSLAITDDADGEYPRETLRELRLKLQRMLDDVDARDSLAFLESTDGVTLSDAQLQAMVKLPDAKLQAIVRGETGSQSSTEMICRIAEELLFARRILRRAGDSE